MNRNGLVLRNCEVGEDEAEAEEELEGFVDFTVATPWERFIASAEGLLRQWQAVGDPGLLESGQAKPLEGHSGVAYVEAEIPHGHKSYRLTFYFPDPALDEVASVAGTDMSAGLGSDVAVSAKGGSSPWEVAVHPLQLWFGIRQFMVIAPMTFSGVVLDSPEASMLLSSLAIASSNADISVPAFVPVHDPSRKAFVGFQHGPRNHLHGGSDYSCHFESDRLGSHVPQNLLSLDGLYYLFAFKIIAELPSTVASVSPDVSVSMRISYRVRYWGSRTRSLPQKAPGADAPSRDQGGRQGGSGGEEAEEEGDEYWAPVDARPWDEDTPWSNWHAVDDPVKGFEVVATWKELHASSSSGMAQIEQLDATWADEWRLRALLVPIEETSYEEEAPGFSGRLHCMLGAYVISSTAPYVEDFVQAQSGQRRGKLSIPPPAVLERVMRDLFNPPKEMLSREVGGRRQGGMEEQSRRNSGRREEESRQLPQDSDGSDAEKPKNSVPKSFVGKAAPANSLFGRFALHALCFGTCNIRSICALWLEFCRELRWHWEEMKLLPSLPQNPGRPDTSACLIHQKLQLLQECIMRQQRQQQQDLEDRMKQAEVMHRVAAARLVGERVEELVRGTAFDDNRDAMNSEVDEEETSDRASDDSGLRGTSGRPETAGGDSSSSGSGALLSPAVQRLNAPGQPRGSRRSGAKEPAGDMWLLAVKRRMFVPHKQDPVFMTEDMIEEKERAFEMLGETPEGREARARLQGDILASDMAAFKAANPGAVLEDFVRWYSPQDWIEVAEGSASQSSAGSSTRSSPARTLSLEKEEQPAGAWPPRGHLSERMLAEEGNIWQELWEDTEPEPAHEQRPIFHFSLEGEKVLHYFDTLVPESLLSQLLCVAFSTASRLLGQADGSDTKAVAAQRSKVEAMIASMWEWSDDQAAGNCTDERVEDLEVLFTAFEKMEGSVLAAASLWRRLQGSQRLVEELMASRAMGIDIPCVSLYPARLSNAQSSASDEWETVGNLFKEQPPEPLATRQGSWTGKRMGNLLLGHEPFEREVIFTSPAFAVYKAQGAPDEFDAHGEAVRGEITPGAEVVKHQLYAKGSLDYLSLALKIASQD